MKKIIFLIISVLTVTSCKKDPPILKGNTLPFENNNIKLELISSSMPSSIRYIYFFDVSKGVALTYRGEIYMTTDKGVTWTLQYTHPTSTQSFFQIFFTTSNIGYAVGGSNGCSGYPCTPPGYYLILKTIDGGSNWTQVFSNAKGVTCIAPNSSGDLYAILNGISKSTNGGLTWATVDSTIFAWDKLVFNNSYGFCTGGWGKIFRSADNGNSWALTTTLKGNHIDDIKFINNYGFCIANWGATVYKTSDNGMTWAETFNSDLPSYVLNPLTNNSCLIFGTGGYSGGDFGTWHGAIRQTINSGATWTEIDLPSISEIRCSSFYSTTEGYVVADIKLIKVTVK